MDFQDIIEHHFTHNIDIGVISYKVVFMLCQVMVAFIIHLRTHYDPNQQKYTLIYQDWLKQEESQ